MRAGTRRHPQGHPRLGPQPPARAPSAPARRSPSALWALGPAVIAWDECQLRVRGSHLSQHKQEMALAESVVPQDGHGLLGSSSPGPGSTAHRHSVPGCLTADFCKLVCPSRTRRWSRTAGPPRHADTTLSFRASHPEPLSTGSKKPRPVLALQGPHVASPAPAHTPTAGHVGLPHSSSPELD